jgi:molybdopterin-guanine dinucleotide biosynthesis protein A
MVLQETVVSKVVAYVLAGGQSRRMGRDKALLPWGEATLLDHSLSRLREATTRAPAILSGPEPRHADRGVPVFPDAVAEAGPLGGVLTGLERLPPDADYGLFLAVDLPLVPVDLLRRLASRAEQGIDAVVAISPSGPEPLCAVYGRTCLEAVRQSVEAGELKMTSFWTKVCVHALYELALAEFGDPRSLFRNVNSVSDYQALTSR